MSIAAPPEIAMRGIRTAGSNIWTRPDDGFPVTVTTLESPTHRRCAKNATIDGRSSTIANPTALRVSYSPMIARYTLEASTL